MAKIDFNNLAKNVGKTVSDVTDVTTKAVVSTVDKAVDVAKDAVDGVVQSVQKKPSEDKKTGVAIKGSLKLMYLLMVVDDEIRQEEMDEFISIGQEMDANFNEYKDSLMEELNALVADLDKEDYYDDIHDICRDTIQEALHGEETTIPIKLLLWNLIAIAYSDYKPHKNEKRLIRYITKQLQLEKSIILEMENTAQTLIAIEHEIEWLKSSDKQFSVVEKELNELIVRKVSIMQGVQALIKE